MTLRPQSIIENINDGDSRKVCGEGFDHDNKQTIYYAQPGSSIAQSVDWGAEQDVDRYLQTWCDFDNSQCP